MPTRALVCYHYPCPDGIFAALAAFLYHRQRHAANHVQFVPLTTWDKPLVADLSLQGDETVYFLDYTGPKGFARSVATSCKEVVVLDHHKTALEDLGGPIALPQNMKAVLDMNKSGATIAQTYFGISVAPWWDYIRSQIIRKIQDQLQDPAIEKCFKFIEDGDLWRWRLSGAKAFYAGLKARDIEYDATKNPNVFQELLKLQPEALIAEGEPILVEEEGMLRQLMESRVCVHLGGNVQLWGTALAIRTNDPRAIKARSELGNRLAIASREDGRAPVGIVAYDQACCHLDQCSSSGLALKPGARESQHGLHACTLDECR